MKMRFASWLVLSAAISISNLAMGQTQITNLSDDGAKVYPWRGGTAQTTQPATSAPVPPVIKGNGDTVRFFQAATGPQAQDKTTGQSGAANFGQDVPQPPSQLPNNPGDKQIPLSVQSNALPESYNRKQDWCRLGEPNRLFGTGPNGFTAGGFAQLGYNSDPTLGGFNFEDNVFRSHQNWLFVGREAQAGCRWDLGFRADVVYGTNGQFFQAWGNENQSGFDNGWDFGAYGWAMPQLYAEVANCDWRIKAGRFLSPIGYESIPSIDNFFFSRTLSRTFLEPFTHTGVLAERQVDNNTTVFGGMTLGWETGFDRNQGGFNLITGVRRRLNQNVKIGIASSLGDTGYRNSGTFTSAFAELQLTDKVCYVVQGDVLNLSGEDGLGFINGLYYHANRCLAVGTRLEWWKSDLGGNGTQSTYDWTFGANYRPHANIVVRPEIRTDWGGLALAPGDLMFACDAIVAF